ERARWPRLWRSGRFRPLGHRDVRQLEFALRSLRDDCRSGRIFHREVAYALHSADGLHRLLDNAVPAIRRSRICPVLPLLRPDSTDNQPVGGAREGHVKKAQMLFSIALLLLGDLFLEWRPALLLLRP